MAQMGAKSKKGITQKHLHSRISYLYQAATHLAQIADQPRASASYLSDAIKKQSDPSREIHHAVATLEAASDENLSTSSTETERRISNFGCDDERICKDFAHSRHFVTHLRAVSSRGPIRLSPAVKHTMCKHCDILLITGSTSTSYIENKSRGGRKAWADVLVTTCTACGTSKRLPVGAKRPLRRKSRIGKAQDVGEQGHRAFSND